MLNLQTSDLDDDNKINLWLSLKIRRKPMDLKLSPLKTSFMAAVQVLAFKVGENDKKWHFTFFVNFLKTFNG